MSDSTRTPSPPRPKSPSSPDPLTRPWSSLPSARRQEVLLVLSQMLAQSLPPAVRKEAGHEHS